MSRYHWFGFIVNEAGEPIENCEVTVKLAGTDDIAIVYYDEFGNANSSDDPITNVGPQLTTLSNGYYEFWVGDISEPFGYRNEQKFKIEWMRIGVAYGMVDYVNVFPLGPQIEEASVLDCVSPSTTKNKLISNYLACKWDTHVESDVVLPNGDFSSVHGLEFVDVEELDTKPNKIINNYYGWHWDHHRLSTVQSYHPSAGTPHGILEVNPLDGSDIVRNKLVSNRDLYDIHGRITDLTIHSDDGDTNLQYQIDNLNWSTDQSSSGWWEVYGNEWTQGIFDEWYVTILHSMNIWYPFVQVWDKAEGELITSTNIQFVDVNTIRVTIQNNNLPNPPQDNLIVRIGNGGIHRHPVTP